MMAPITDRPAADRTPRAVPPTSAQRRYLRLGLTRPGGKLPLFDGQGQQIPTRTVQACLNRGWIVRSGLNPVEPAWTLCRLTPRGRRLAARP